MLLLNSIARWGGLFCVIQAGSREVLLASGDCPETSALCGKPDPASKESVRIQCWEFVTENWSFPSCGSILEKLEWSQQARSISDIWEVKNIGERCMVKAEEWDVSAGVNEHPQLEWSKEQLGKLGIWALRKRCDYIWGKCSQISHFDFFQEQELE